jgi:branched-chain amino acid transport system substrate-binding protein
MSNTVKVITGVIVLIILALASSNRYRSGDDPSRVLIVGALLPLTGANASYGELARQGIELALDSLHPEDRKLITVVYEDTQFQSAPAINAYEKLKSQGVKVFLTLGSQVATTIGPRAVRDGNLDYELTAVSPGFSDRSPLTCRATLTADVSSKVLVNYLLTNGYRNVATFTTRDEQGASVDSYLSQYLREGGGTLIQEEKYGLDETDFKTHLSKIKASGADALVLIAPGQHAERVLRQLKELGLRLPVFSNNFTVKNQNLKDLTLAEGIIFTDYGYDDRADTALNSQFLQKYNSAPAITAVNAYDAIMILTAASKESRDPEHIARFITRLSNYHAAAGNLSFNNDCEATQRVALLRVEGGEFTKVQ